MAYMPRTMLVTGGAGFIGSNYIRYALERDASLRIVNLDKLTYAGSSENLKDLPDPSRYMFVRGDICDGDLVDRLLREYAVDTIAHFAAESHVDRSIAGPGAFVQSNVVGTFTLLEAARRYWLDESGWDKSQCRFHHISTDEVYGTLEPDAPPFTEKTGYAPNSPYSASKAGSDHMVRAWFHTYGLPVTTTNCSNNYGPYQHDEKFIPTVIRSCAKRQSIPVYGNGSNIRDWLHVIDHCRGIDTVVRHGKLGDVYNIGGGNEKSNIEVVDLICKVMDEMLPQEAPHARLISYVEDRPGHDWRYAIDAEKMWTEMRWKPQICFEDGIRDAVVWYLGILDGL